MKLNLVTCITLALLQSPKVRASSLRGDVRVVRHLEGEFAFLVSQTLGDENEDLIWCITAENGVGNFQPLGLDLCDVDNAPDNQLWRIDGEGKLASKVDTEQCMIINDGETVSDNDVVRTASCSADTTLNRFFWDAGVTDQLRLVADPAFCLTHLGPLPQDDDDIRVKPCKEEPRYSWNYSPRASYIQLKSSNYAGCIEARKGEVSNDNTIVLGACNADQLWKYDDGLFRSSLDETKCLQAARGGSIEDGSKMRIFTCDRNEDGQMFDYSPGGSISLKSLPDLCVVFRGVRPSVGSDPIILKECMSVNPKDRLNWDSV